MTPFEAMPWLWPIVKVLHYILLYGKFIAIPLVIILIAIAIKKHNRKNNKEKRESV